MKVTLEDLVGPNGLFTDGDWVETKDQDPNGNVRLIQLADVGDGNFVNKSSRYMNSIRAGELRCTNLEAGDVLIARMPDPIGRACIFPGLEQPCVTVVDVCVLRPDLKRVCPKWLLHKINGEGFRRAILSSVTGSTRQRISRGNLSKISFTLPPLDEQRRMAAILDKADALRRKRRRALDLLESLTRSIFLDMFGSLSSNSNRWVTANITDACELIIDCVNRTAPVVDYSTPYKMLRTTNVRNGRVDVENVRFVTKETFDRWNRRTIPRRGDVLLTREAPVGGVGMLLTDDQVFLGQRLMLYRPKQGVMTSEFLVWLFTDKYLRDQFDRMGSGSTVKHLPLPACRAFEVRLPPIALQERFSERINLLKTTQSSSVNHDMQISKLSSSLQHRIFSGQL